MGHQVHPWAQLLCPLPNDRFLMSFSPSPSRMFLAVALAVATAAVGVSEESTGVGLEKISLPSGPGSIEGLGDSFEPQLNSGTSSYSVKIASPPGVAGLQPEVTLRYNSGGGNSHFGIAWNSGQLSIQRQTEKGLPNYGSGDTFTLGGEELVPLSDGSYRVENESSFQRIVRNGSGWIVYSKNGTRHFLGSTAISSNASRIVRPGITNPTFDDTFKWCVDNVIDVHGNRMEYHYQTFPESPGDIYCGEIRYSIFGANYQAISFAYEIRPDVFSSFLSGFEVKTSRRCYRIAVTSGGALVRQYGLYYVLPADDPIEGITPTDAGLSFSLLRQVTQFDKGPALENHLPPLRLGYSRLDVQQVQRGTLSNNPLYSLGNPNVSLTDINADALPDFFFTDPQNGRHSVYYNRGYGRFSAETLFTSFPTGVTLDNPGVQLADFDGDSRIDLVHKAGGSQSLFSFYPNTTLPRGNDESSPAWGTEVAFQPSYPPFDLDDPSVRTLDLNNDKRMDFMRTTSAGFIYYYNRGDFWEEDGIYLYGENQMGNITYSDGIQFEASGQSNVYVKLADMNGDRLLDLVRIRLFGTDLEVEFWPNRGRGYWGSRTAIAGNMDLGVAPIEDVFLRDINGDGIADVLVPSYDFVSYWVNQGNSGYSGRFEVAGTPEYIRGTTILTQADINGNGSTDLLWENFDPSAGGYRIDYVDFIGAVKPNLLRVIDNGIGLLTQIDYATTTDFYLAAQDGGNPWTTRLPFASQVVKRITKTFGLDLDAIPGEDVYVTDFAYHDGYYDAFEKEFRGFSFARKVERGDDRQGFGGAAPEVNSPSTITRMAFHTGVPDGIDNNGNNLTDEFDPIGGYEEEALKGKVLWTETTLLTNEFDGADNDGDGFIDESDEGPHDGQIASDSVVFTRQVNNWQLKTIHNPQNGFPDVPFRVINGQKVTFPFPAQQSTQIIDAVGTLHPTDSHGTPTSAVSSHTVNGVDHFGNAVLKQELGVTSGGGLSYDDERVTTTLFAKNISAWIVGLPADTSVTDETGQFVSHTQNIYDNQGVGAVGNRGLLTEEVKYIGTGNAPIEQFSKVNGDPRGGGTVTTRYQYDGFGNPIEVKDPLNGVEAGHVRTFDYDPVFQTYVIGEHIDTGGPGGTLSASATYDKGGGVITSSTDYNGKVSIYRYDSFFRIVGIVKPGDSVGAPTSEFAYQLTDRVRQQEYHYDILGNLALQSVGGTVTSRVTVRSREVAGGGTFDIVQISDGAGHKLGTIEEGETAGQFVYKGVKRYTSRGHERDTYLPFFAGTPAFVAPPANGDRVTMYYDAVGRNIRSVNPPEIAGGARTISITEFRPLKQTLFDEEDAGAGPHANTPHVQYRDGLDRLVGVDELVGSETWPTRYDYDLQGNLVGITDSQSNRKWFRHDGLGRMIFMEDPDRGKMFYTYDAASNLVETVDAKAQRNSYSYDGANRILTEDYEDAVGLVPDVSYFYDQGVAGLTMGDGTSDTAANIRGQLAYVRDLSGEEHLSYDDRGRMVWKVKRVPDPLNGVLVSYRCGYDYDSLDRLIEHQYPDGDRVGHTYNSRNLLETISGGPGGDIITAVDYIASGQIQSTSYGNGVDTSLSYDPRLRLKTLVTTGAKTLIDYSYTFDGASNITQIDDNRNLSGEPDFTERENTQVFDYDDLYRLTRVDYPETSGHIGYGYDRIGNMISKASNIDHLENGLSVTNLGGMSYGGSAGPAGRQGRTDPQPGPHALTGVSEGGRVYSYDANGNMVDIDGLLCTWDFKDRLVQVENDLMMAKYTYDYSDRRIRKEVYPKDAQGTSSTLPEVVLYPDRSWEIREDGAPVKYVWNGETRVARVSTSLDPTRRIQRFSLQAGWNICVLAVNVSDAGSILTGGIVEQAYRFDENDGSYHSIGATEFLPFGTLLRIRASENGELPLQGTPGSPAERSYVVGRHWVGNDTFEPIEVTSLFPADSDLWFFDAETQLWRVRPGGELGGADDLERVNGQLKPGEALFSVNSAPFTVTPSDPANGVQFYHQDHLGSTNSTTDVDGNLKVERSFLPFGATRSSYSNEQQNLLHYDFSQKERDKESNTHYFEARYLTAGIGRFLSFDPVLASSAYVRESPQRGNPYAYCRSRPTVLCDPTGLSDRNSSAVETFCDATKDATEFVFDAGGTVLDVLKVAGKQLPFVNTSMDAHKYMYSAGCKSGVDATAEISGGLVGDIGKGAILASCPAIIVKGATMGALIGGPLGVFLGGGISALACIGGGVVAGEVIGMSVEHTVKGAAAGVTAVANEVESVQRSRNRDPHRFDFEVYRYMTR